MNVVEQNAIVSADLPCAELADYLQLQSGATGAVRQTQILETVLRSAICDIEARIGRVLLRREFEFHALNAPKLKIEFGYLDHIEVLSVTSVSEAQGSGTPVQYSANIVAQSTQIVIESTQLNEDITVLFRAGKTHWDQVEGDLQMAILTLAAHQYLQRNDPSLSNVGMPNLVKNLIEKHRKLKILRGV